MANVVCCHRFYTLYCDFIEYSTEREHRWVSPFELRGLKIDFHRTEYKPNIKLPQTSFSFFIFRIPPILFHTTVSSTTSSPLTHPTLITRHSLQLPSLSSTKTPSCYRPQSCPLETPNTTWPSLPPVPIKPSVLITNAKPTTASPKAGECQQQFYICREQNSTIGCGYYHFAWEGNRVNCKGCGWRIMY